MCNAETGGDPLVSAKIQTELQPPITSQGCFEEMVMLQGLV